MILDLLKEQVQKKAAERSIVDVRIGLCYTGVLLDDGSTGVAFTFRDELGRGCLRRGGPFAGQRADAVIEGITSPDLLERTVGIAAANALLSGRNSSFIEGDTLDVLEPGPDDVVGMVGYFGPVVPGLKRRVRELRIFEKKTMGDPDVYPEEKMFELLPSCTIALITSTALINKTLEKILEVTRQCKKTALAGASTPLAREVFKSRGVTLLSGIVITDPQGMLRVVSEGGGTRSFKGLVKKVNVTV